jgi:hypothetical protein
MVPCQLVDGKTSDLRLKFSALKRIGRLLFRDDLSTVTRLDNVR